VQAVDAQLNAKFPQLGAELAAHPDTFKTLASYPNPSAIPPDVLNQALLTVGPTALTQAQDPQAQQLLTYLNTNAPPVQAAQARAPHEWQRWLWVCAAGEIIFIPMIFVMAGYWRPREAREDIERREQLSLAGAGPLPTTA
jgi:hypothetical protein